MPMWIIGSDRSWKTFPERLEEAGVSWRIYQNELSVASGLEGEDDAWLANFARQPAGVVRAVSRGLSQDAHGVRRADGGDAAGGDRETARRQAAWKRSWQSKEKLLAVCLKQRAQLTPEARAQLSPREVSLHEKAFTTNEEDPGYRATGDAAAITMAVSNGKWWFRNPIRCTGSAKMWTTENFRRFRGWCLRSVSPIIPDRPGTARWYVAGDAEYPDRESGGLEEDDLHSHLRRERRLLRSRSAVRRAGAGQSGIGKNIGRASTPASNISRSSRT